ncbi:MAG: penicillin-binding transpeptidase domain-containing protein [Actinomycetia bacterium]|nr:penicillin-binding transpeptidase domain-containing protein [Actinomycetes bacterium]
MTSPLRIGILGLVMIGFFSILGIRLWTMQVTEAQAYETRAEDNQVRVVLTPAPRGDIWDSKGVKLAGTRSALAAIIDLALIEADERGPLSQNLAAFLDEPASEIEELLSATNLGSQITVATDITDAQATFLLEHREMFPGVNVIPQPVRTYPAGEVGAHVIGYIGKPNEQDLEERDDINGEDFLGKAGVERAYDELLQGVPGVVEYKVDARRKVLSLENEVSPSAGGSLILTIDSEVQAQLQTSLQNGLMQARRLEMEERRLAIEEQSRDQRVAQALRDARAEALEQALEEKEALDAAVEAGEPTTTTTPDDGERRIGPVEVDEADVLSSLYSGLPIDADGICVPVQRVTIPHGGSATVTGIEPRLAKFESVATVDGELVAHVVVEGKSYKVGDHDPFAGTLRVLEISEDRLILNHSDPWCPIRAVGVVLDPNDGAVIAMSSYPTFDPTAFVDGLSVDQWNSLGTVSAFTNFAVQGQYAPASTFKTVPYVLALEENYYPINRGVGDKEIGEEQTGGSTQDDAPVVSTTTLLDGPQTPVNPEDQDEDALLPLRSDTDEYSCTGEFRFRLNDGSFQTKRDWIWPGAHGPLDLHGALQASCDLYFWDVALRLWNERGDDSGIDKENLLQEYARGFGFGSTTGIDLPFEREGLIPDRAWFISEQRDGSPRVRQDGSWVGGDLMDMAVGQGAVLATPLQMANGLAAMVNGGTVWQPYVVEEVVDQDGNVITENQPTILNQMDLDPRTTTLLLADLQQVVNNQERGTARSAFRDFGEGVELIGGKTGTGEIIKAPRSERFRQVDSAFFIGVAPVTDPEYVISVVIERGGSGGRIAAPVARQVFQFLMNGPEGVTPIAPGLDAD